MKTRMLLAVVAIAVGLSATSRGAADLAATGLNLRSTNLVKDIERRLTEIDFAILFKQYTQFKTDLAEVD